MKMPHSQSTITHILTLVWLSILILITIPAVLPNSEEISIHIELIMTTKSSNASSLNDDPSEFEFINNYLKTTHIQNLKDDPLDLFIPSNMLGGSYANPSFYNVTIFDNLGNSFEPIIESNIIQNPDINVILPPNYEYNISISFFSNSSIFFDSDNLEYVYPVNVSYNNPVTLIMKFPKEYTILRYSKGGRLEQEDDFTIITFPEDEDLDIYTRFVPFSIHGSITSFKATIDIPTVFPIKGAVKGSIEKSIILPTQFGIWNINPLLIVDTNFPDYTQNIAIEKVWDSEGECNEISQPVQDLDANCCGLYFIDFPNRVVKVYPHYSYKSEDFYQYEVGVTFVAPSGYETLNLEAAKQTSPFTYMSAFIIDRIIQTDSWNLNLTGNLEIKFILPEGSDPIPSESGNPTIGKEDNRPTASYVYNAIGELYPSNWRVKYDIIDLRNYFLFVIITIGALITVASLSIILEAFSYQKLALGLIPVSGLMIWNIRSFLALGGFENTLTILFYSSIALWIASIIVGIWKTKSQVKKPHSETEVKKTRPQKTRKHRKQRPHK